MKDTTNQTLPDTSIIPSKPSFDQAFKANLANLRALSAKPTLDQLWQSYMLELKPTSQRVYRGCLERLADFLAQSTITNMIDFLCSLDVAQANLLAIQWKESMKEKSPATINLHLSALKSLSRFLRMSGLIAWSIEIKGKQARPYRDTAGPSVRAIQKALRYLRENTCLFGQPWQAKQLEAILILMFLLGLRRNEVVALEMEDVANRQDKSSIWIKGKGRDDKEALTLPKKAQAALSEWIDMRDQVLTPHLEKQHAHALFLGGDGKPLKASALYHQITRLGRKVGETIKPHGIRHSAITNAFEQAKHDPSISIAELQKFSRHKKVETLLIYRDAVEDDALRVAESLEKSI